MSLYKLAEAIVLVTASESDIELTPQELEILTTEIVEEYKEA